MDRKVYQAKETPLLHTHTHHTLIQPTRKDSHLIVTLNLPAYRLPIILKFQECTMSLLRQVLWLNLKKIMKPAQYSSILGFQTEGNDDKVDYALQYGLGELQLSIVLNCLTKGAMHAPISILNYKVCRMISTGGFSKVYLLRDLRSGNFRAGKFILKKGANIELVRNQYSISSQLEHPFIVKTYEFIQTEQFFIIVMDYCPGGELFELIKKHRNMTENMARFYIVETLLALKHLHQQSIVFRDIKPQNILIDHFGHAKLADFGLAKRVDQLCYSFCGSLDYMAPQVLLDNGHSFEVDYYSVGNLLFQILMGSPPYYHPKHSYQQTKYHILHSAIRFPNNTQLSSKARDLITALLEKNPSRRLGHQGGIDEILEHEWFQHNDLSAYLNLEIQPPLQTVINFTDEEKVDPQNSWQKLIESDLLRQTLKQKKNYRLLFAGIRHHSLMSHKSSQKPQKQNRYELKIQERNRPHRNMSLPFTLSHKRAISEAPNKRLKTNDLTAKNSLDKLKSLNLSRKCSTPNKVEESKTLMEDNRASQPQLHQFMTVSVKNKPGIHKSKKGGKVLFKAKN